jgi:ribosomal-protein-alanine N-acetyltransferase
MPAKRLSPRSRSSRRERNSGLRQDWKPLLVREEHLRDLPSKPETADVQFNLRDYRAADFERLWQIDQLCFPQGISYTQMELSGFITRRNAITLVADFDELHSEEEKLSVTGLQPGDALNSRAPGASLSEIAAGTRKIAGFIIAHAVRGKAGRILTLDIVPPARRLGLGSLLMDECERQLRSFGCKEIYLETAVNNEPALRLYRKLGYQVLRTLPNYYATHSLDAFLMGKPL